MPQRSSGQAIAWHLERERNESVLIHINNLPRAPQPNTSPKQVPSQTPNSRLVLTSPPFLVSYVCPYRIYDMILVVHLIMPICGPCLSKDMGAIRGLASLIARSQAVDDLERLGRRRRRRRRRRRWRCHCWRCWNWLIGWLRSLATIEWPPGASTRYLC